jgi:tetratricopeptide (TPR) repeat protein
MDMWKWVSDTQKSLRADGHDRLADLVYDIPEDVASGREKLAQAALPEAVALARAIKHPWLEVFFRHWVMNGRVCRFKEGEAALKDVVELFEFAHRPENIACPQTVCTTQDIAACYGNVDGPGYAAERIAVCEETLQRIDPTWGCHDCITRELIDALVDGGRAGDALDLAVRHIPIARDAGNDDTTANHWTRARAMFAAGAHEDTLTLLAFIDEQRFEDDTEADIYGRKCLRFRTLAAMGRMQEALAALPPEEEGAEHDENIELAAGFDLLCAALPQHNTHVTGRRVSAALRRYHRAGAHRLTLDTLSPVVRLAVARGARWSATEALALARPHLPKLRLPLDAPREFAALEALVRAMPVCPPLPVPAQELAGYLEGRDDTSPEQALEFLLGAAAVLPDDPEIACGVAASMSECGAGDDSVAYLWRFVRSHPDQSHSGAELLTGLLARQDHAAVAELAQVLDQASPAMAHWCRARLAFAQQRWSEVGEHIARLLERDPEAEGPKHMWAEAALYAKQFDTALRLRLEQADIGREQGSSHWHVLVAASACGRWDLVRRFAAAMERPFELSGSEGVVEEKWGAVKVRFFEEGEWQERYALRTGPVTARITSMSWPGMPQHVHDWVVFDPRPVEEMPDDVDPADFYFTYDAVHVIAAGGFGGSALVDGAYPGDADFARLTAAFDALGWEWSVRSADDYTVTEQESGEEMKGVYFALAAPEAVAPAVVDAKLKALTAGFAHPLCWPTLAALADADPGWHRDVVRRYGL